MTAGGINRIIAQMKGRGITSAIVICPICEGGTRKRRTLSVDLRDGVWLYLCHRGTCPTKGAVPAIGNDGRPIAGGGSNFTPKPLTMEYRTPYPSDGDPIAVRLVPLVSNVPEFAMRHGLRVGLGKDNGTHVWIVRNVKGEQTGHVTRTEDKRVLTWREVEAPFYGAFDPRTAIRNRMDVCIIVEDPLSAALLAEEGYCAIALHGTNMSREAAAEIAGWEVPKVYLVALDSDEAGRAGSQKVMDRLRVAGAPKVWQWLLPRDVHKLDWRERGELCADIEKTLDREAEWQTTHS